MSYNKKINELKVGSILSYVQTIVGAAISLIYTPAMLHYLGKGEYGVYSIAATTISYVSLLNMGFSSSYVRYYAKCKANNDDDALAKTNGLFMLAFSVIGVLALVAGFALCALTHIIFSDGLTSDELVKTRVIMGILAIGMSFNLGTSLFASIITAHEKFVFQKMVNLLKTILSPTLTYVFLLMGYKSIMMSIISVGLTIIADSFYVIYCLKELKVKFNFRNPQKKQLIDIASFSGFIAISSIVDQINWSIDKILLGRFKGSEIAAVYSVAAQINTLYMQISTAISNVFVPRINRMAAEKRSENELTELFIKIGRIQLMVLLPIIVGFTCLGKEFIEIWTPNGYGDAYYIALLLMIPATIPYIQNAGISIQTAMAKHKFRAGLYTIMAVINFILSVVLCQMYGGIGCAIGTALSMVIANGIVMNIYYQRVIKLDIRKFWMKMSSFLPAAVIMSIIGIVLSKIISITDYFRLLIVACIMMIVYVCVIWSFGLNSDEKRMFTSILRRNK